MNDCVLSVFVPYLAAFAAGEYCPPPGTTTPPAPGLVPAPPITPKTIT